MGLRDIGATLPPGFRFYPSDEELVCHYLYKKITNEQVLKGTLVEIDLHTCEPWQLPEVAKLNATEWYFFSFRDRKYATGYRTNRATISGYWKATGKDRTVLEPVTREIVGMRKTLVFYRNRAPNGIKTGWIMHEFRMESPHMPPKEDWVLCRVFHKDKQIESTENNSPMKLSPQHMLETIPFASPLNFSPPIQQSNNMQLDASGFDQFSSFCTTPPHQGHHHHQTHINQNSTINTTNTTSLLNLLQFSYEKNTTPINNPNITEMMNSRNNEDDDQYGFLWDMDLEETSGLENMGAAVSSHLDDMRFEIDNSMVFL